MSHFGTNFVTYNYLLFVASLNQSTNVSISLTYFQTKFHLKLEKTRRNNPSLLSQIKPFKQKQTSNNKNNNESRKNYRSCRSCSFDRNCHWSLCNGCHCRHKNTSQSQRCRVSSTSWELLLTFSYSIDKSRPYQFQFNNSTRIVDKFFKNQ